MPEPPLTPPKLDEIPDPLPPGPAAQPLSTGPRPLRGGPTRAEVARARRLALLIGSGWVIGQLAIAGIRSDMDKIPLAYTLALAVAPFAAGAVCFAAALRPGRLGLGVRVAGLALLAVLAPLIFMVANYVISPPYPGAPHGNLRSAVYCFNIAIAWTLLPLVIAGFALRSTFISRALWRSAVLGAGAGLVVSATTMLRCPLSDPLHMALSHGGAVAATALLGAIVLSRVTRA